MDKLTPGQIDSLTKKRKKSKGHEILSAVHELQVGHGLRITKSDCKNFNSLRSKVSLSLNGSDVKIKTYIDTVGDLIIERIA